MLPIELEKLAELVAFVMPEEIFHTPLTSVGATSEAALGFAVVAVERWVGEDVIVLTGTPSLHVGEKMRDLAVNVREMRERLRDWVDAAWIPSVICLDHLAIVVPFDKFSVTSPKFLPRAFFDHHLFAVGQCE